MIPTIDSQIEPLFLLALAVITIPWLSRLTNSTIRSRAVSIADYLYKMARLTGASEYGIFCKSAEEWPVSESMVKEHFKAYLLHEVTPCYVNAFVRKHQRRVDELHFPPL